MSELGWILSSTLAMSAIAWIGLLTAFLAGLGLLVAVRVLFG